MILILRSSNINTILLLLFQIIEFSEENLKQME